MLPQPLEGDLIAIIGMSRTYNGKKTLGMGIYMGPVLDTMIELRETLMAVMPMECMYPNFRSDSWTYCFSSRSLLQYISNRLPIAQTFHVSI